VWTLTGLRWDNCNSHRRSYCPLLSNPRARDTALRANWELPNWNNGCKGTSEMSSILPSCSQARECLRSMLPTELAGHPLPSHSQRIAQSDPESNSDSISRLNFHAHMSAPRPSRCVNMIIWITTTAPAPLPSLFHSESRSPTISSPGYKTF
jgi:hypothetical protein